MNEKTPNYTEEMVARLHEVYDGNATEEVRKAQVAQLAEELGRSAASVRAKLTREKIYVPLEKAPTGKNTVRKAELVASIAEKIGMDVDAAGSLEKVTKAVLTRVLNAVS